MTYLLHKLVFLRFALSRVFLGIQFYHCFLFGFLVMLLYHVFYSDLFLFIFLCFLLLVILLALIS